MLYAARQQTHGFRYSEDTVWQKEFFEEMFPYEETEDQWDASNPQKQIWKAAKLWTA